MKSRQIIDTLSQGVSRNRASKRAAIASLAACAVAGLMPRSAHAVNYTWTGAGTTANWSDPNNWNGGIPANSSSTSITFGPGVTTNLTNSNDILNKFQIAAFNFIAGAPAYNVGGDSIVFAGNTSVIDNAVGVTETLTMPITFPTLGRQINVAAGATLLSTGGIVSPNANGNSNNLQKIGQGTLTLSGINTFYVQLLGGTLNLDFTQPNAPTTGIDSNGLIQYFSGNLNIIGASSSNSQTFISTTFRLGSTTSTTVTGGATLNLNGISFTTAGTASTVFNGPATIDSSGNPVAATGTITTTTAGQTAGLMAPANGSGDYATVGQSDWASASGSTPFIITGGSQVPGFYTAATNGATPAVNVNWDISSAQVPTGIGGTNNAAVTTPGTNIVDSIRFNTSSAPYIAVSSGAFLKTGGVLITPAMGTVNTAIDGLALGASGTNIVQNNTAAVFVTGVNQGGVGGSFYSATANSAAEVVTKSGPGTWFIDPTTNSVPINYQNSSGTVTNTGQFYNYAAGNTTSAAAFFFGGGVTVINSPYVLGNPLNVPMGATQGAIGTIDLNGGTLMASANMNAVGGLNNSTGTTVQSGLSRQLYIGPGGGGLAAAPGALFNFGGALQAFTNGSGPLVIGIPASAANGNVLGLVPGTGPGTANPALYATGTVGITGSGGSFNGGYVVDSGTLRTNGISSLGALVAGSPGVTLNGGALQYFSGATPNVLPFSGDVTFAGNFSTGLTVGPLGGVVDLNNATFAGTYITYTRAVVDGGGNLTVMNGTLGLSGNNSLAAGFNVGNGVAATSLIVTGTLSSTTPVLVTTNANLNTASNFGMLTVSGGNVSTGAATPYLGQLSGSNITYNSGTFQIGVSNTSAGVFNASGAIVFNATPNFVYSLSSNPASGETLPIFNASSIAFNNGAVLLPTTIGHLVLTPAEIGTTQIVLNLTSIAENLVWHPVNANNAWDINTTNNWLNNAPAQDVYYEGDTVNFNDSNGGVYTVNLATTVNPASVTVNNSAGNYMFNGPGGIAGATSLVKSGSGGLTLNSSNTYSGGTVINAGTVMNGVANALPTTGTLTVQGTGIYDLAGNNQTIAVLSDGGVSTGSINSSSGLATLTINGSTNSSFGGTITGGVGLNIALNVSNASVTLSSSNTYTGGTSVSAGKLVLASGNAFPTGTSLNISTGATVQLANHAGSSAYVPKVSLLTNNGTIDLVNNAMVLQSANASVGTISSQVAAAYNNGLWNGTGSGIITSSLAAADSSHLTAVGVATGLTSFEGNVVSAGDVLLKYTYYGDANLDGRVDGTDYSRIDNGFLTPGTTGWWNGDFNYDGVINGSDYTLIDNAFNTQGALLSAEVATPTAQIGGASGTSAVPEPASLGILGLATIGVLGRRRRRSPVHA